MKNRWVGGAFALTIWKTTLRKGSVSIVEKAQKAVLIAVFVTLGVVLVGVICFVRINPPRDNIGEAEYPSEFFCDVVGNRVDNQTVGNCAAYATAYVLRSLGEDTDGEKIAPEIKRIFGFVPARSIVDVFESHGFSANAYRGSTEALKRRLANGVPLIVFVSVSDDTHYAVVVGYDTRYFYLADSLAENKNVDGNGYNRRLTVEEFEQIRKTDTILLDDIYIAVSPTDGLVKR